MKILSVTQEDGRVVEMSRLEFQEFCLLAKAVEGIGEGEAYHTMAMRGIPNEFEYFEESTGAAFEGTFGAIRAFYEALFRANEMQHLVNGFYALLKKG